MERSTAVTISRVYAVLTYICAVLLFAAGLGLIFGGSLLGFVMDAATAGMMDLPSEFVGKVVGAAALVVGILVLLLSFLYFKIGRALWRQLAWGRVAAIVLAVLELFSFPFGTLIGGFAIWFFGFSAEGKALFAQPTTTGPSKTPAKPAPRAPSRAKKK